MLVYIVSFFDSEFTTLNLIRKLPVGDKYVVRFLSSCYLSTHIGLEFKNTEKEVFYTVS